MNLNFSVINKKVKETETIYCEGVVQKVIGLTVEVQGIKAFVGELCYIVNNMGKKINCEVVGFKEDFVILMPLDPLIGIAPGCRVIPQNKPLVVNCSDNMLGKVLDGLGNDLSTGESLKGEPYPLENQPPDPLQRKRIKEIMPTGVRSIDGFITVGEGQRIGIFAGSGVGKSTTLGMIAREAKADVNVIALIGERGREVLEFIEKDLGPLGMKKSIVVCATSDKPALIRLKGALTATAIAEYFRDKEKKVILMMDSVTRFAMAQREIGLATGEPPATKGYTPSVYAKLPELMERSGMSSNGSITAFYTVLVDGDDFSEIEIKKSSNVFRLLSRIDEEVHRFTINYHRDIRSKGSIASVLDNIPGIGTKRRKELIKKYGSVNKIKSASVYDLSKIVPLKVAEDIKTYLNTEDK